MSGPDRFEVTRLVLARPTEVFAVLTDPHGHVRIDSSGMLMSADGEPVHAVGDTFVVHMDREALNDTPMGRYDVVVTITAYEQERLVEWGITTHLMPEPLPHRYGYRLEPAADGTLVSSYYDWSAIPEAWRGRGFPILPEAALRATLGILARTVEQPAGPSAGA